MAIYTADPKSIADAAKHLRAGGLVAAPTETVYGLFGDAGNEAAVASIFKIKGRPLHTPLILHFATAEAAMEIAEFDARARYLAQRLWPGPLTLILPLKPSAKVSPLAVAAQKTVALRVPDHPVALALIAASQLALAAPSANLYGRLSPTTAAHVEEQLGDRLAMILNGGACTVGVESTILDLSQPLARILRLGAISAETIEASIGVIARTIPENGQNQITPHSGSAASHYAPRLPVRLNAICAIADIAENLLSFGPQSLDGFKREINLSPEQDLKHAAANLYAALRSLDDGTVQQIAATPIPEIGIGRAINDRLRRAAAPRVLERRESQAQSENTHVPIARVANPQVPINTVVKS